MTFSKSPLLLFFELFIYLITNGIEFCQNFFLHWVMWLCDFSSLACYGGLHCLIFKYWASPKSLVKKTHLVMVFTSFYIIKYTFYNEYIIKFILLNFLCLILLRIFMSIFMRDIGLEFSYFILFWQGSLVLALG